MILACSGGSNVGQLSNQASVELTQEGFGRLFCLAGIGGGLTGFVQSAKDTPALVAIDGCPVGCAKAILEKNNISLENYLVLTDIGIEKNKSLNLGRSEIDKVKAAVKSLLKKETSISAAEPVNIGCGCSCGQ